MNPQFQQMICDATGADALFHIEDIQSLWSGYGKIMRYGLKGATLQTIIVKHVVLPSRAGHPRGWNTDLSHQRKVESYHVEINWYRYWGNQCKQDCRIPACYTQASTDNEFMIALEDLDASGYMVRKTSVSFDEMHLCLCWLANFHARFMGQTPAKLWPVGTYWHLQTRPHELQALNDEPLRDAAAWIDQKLNTARFRTLVHGDAKLANFCFTDNSDGVAAVDFQYVGGGCGIKDVAYFIGSCLDEDDCERHASRLLDDYFFALRRALRANHCTATPDQVEQEWRMLYPLAWTDFYRFLKGWSPGHWKIHSYSERLAREVLAGPGQEQDY